MYWLQGEKSKQSEGKFQENFEKENVPKKFPKKENKIYFFFF